MASAADDASPMQGFSHCHADIVAQLRTLRGLPALFSAVVASAANREERSRVASLHMRLAMP